MFLNAEMFLHHLINKTLFVYKVNKTVNLVYEQQN
jgi:hypothetical protein